MIPGPIRHSAVLLQASMGTTRSQGRRSGEQLAVINYARRQVNGVPRAWRGAGR